VRTHRLYNHLTLNFLKNFAVAVKSRQSSQGRAKRVILQGRGREGEGEKGGSPYIIWSDPLLMAGGGEGSSTRWIKEKKEKKGRVGRKVNV